MMNTKGFTLIELLIIIAIIAILVGIAATAGRAALDRTNVEKFIKELNADLMNAQGDARNRNRRYFVVFTATQYTIYEDTDPIATGGDGLLNPALDRLVKRIAVSPRYAMTIPGPVVNLVIFNPWQRGGMIDSNPGPFGTQQSIRVTQGFGSAINCILLTLDRTQAGWWDGGTCRAQ